MNSKRKKSARKPKVEALATVESQPAAVGLPHPEAVQKLAFLKRLNKRSRTG
jgi:hypothetical protein